jgi:hypothetical protein
MWQNSKRGGRGFFENLVGVELLNRENVAAGQKGHGARQVKPAPTVTSQRWRDQGIDEAMPSIPKRNWESTQVVDFPDIHYEFGGGRRALGSGNLVGTGRFLGQSFRSFPPERGGIIGIS